MQSTMASLGSHEKQLFNDNIYALLCAAELEVDADVDDDVDEHDVPELRASKDIEASADLVDEELDVSISDTEDFDGKRYHTVDACGEVRGVLLISEATHVFLRAVRTAVSTSDARLLAKQFKYLTRGKGGMSFPRSKAGGRPTVVSPSGVLIIAAVCAEHARTLAKPSALGALFSTVCATPLIEELVQHHKELMGEKLKSIPIPQTLVARFSDALVLARKMYKYAPLGELAHVLEMALVRGDGVKRKRDAGDTGSDALLEPPAKKQRTVTEPVSPASLPKEPVRVFPPPVRRHPTPVKKAKPPMRWVAGTDEPSWHYSAISEASEDSDASDDSFDLDAAAGFHEDDEASDDHDMYVDLRDVVAEEDALEEVTESRFLRDALASYGSGQGVY